MFLVLTFWSVTFGCAWMGWRAGSFTKFQATILGFTICCILVGGALVARNLSWIPESIIGNALVYLQYTWFTPPAALLFFLAARQSESQSVRQLRMIKGFVILLVAFSSLRLIDQQGWHNRHIASEHRYQ